VFDQTQVKLVVRAKFSDAGVIAGAFGGRSLTSGLNESSVDIYLEETYELNTDDDFALEPNGLPRRTGVGVLLRREDVRWLEVFEAPPGW